MTWKVGIAPQGIKLIFLRTFQILNEDTVYKELDFADFETAFQLRQQPSSSTQTIERMKRFQERAAEEIHVIDQNRAKNMGKNLYTYKTSS